MTIKGTGFPGYVPLQSVRVGGMEALTGLKVFTDGQGNFSVSLTVPRVGQGSHAGSNETKEIGGGQPVGSPVIVTVVAIVGGEKATGYLVVDPNAGVNSAMPAGLAMSELGSKLQVVWHYDRETKAWRFYDPLLPEFSDLGEMVAGEVYLVQVATTTTVTLNHQSPNPDLLPGQLPERNCLVGDWETADRHPSLWATAGRSGSSGGTVHLDGPWRLASRTLAAQYEGSSQ